VSALQSVVLLLGTLAIADGLVLFVMRGHPREEAVKTIVFANVAAAATVVVVGILVLIVDRWVP